MQKSKAFKRLPNTHKNKSRFGLTKGAGQCFIFWNGMYGKATGRARKWVRTSCYCGAVYKLRWRCILSC